MKLATLRRRAAPHHRARAALAGGLMATLAATGTGVYAASMPAQAATRTPSAASAGSPFATAFADPAGSYRPKTRVWWACGNITTAEIQAQFEGVKDAGFSGVEIICFSALPEYGWGSDAMNDRMQDALDIGTSLGLTVDWTVSGSWPLNVPGVGADDAAAAKEMVQGSAIVTAGQTFSGAVPEPTIAAANGVTKKELIDVQAIRCATDCTGAAPIELDRSSAVDLTDQVSNGQLTWQAPAAGTWILLSSWQRGTGQLSVVYGYNNVTPGVVVDHFSRAGADAGINYWNTDVLTPQMRAGLRATGGDIFEDSLELNSNFHWTPGFLDEFEKRRGYDLRPYLPILVIPGIDKQYSPVTVDDDPQYSFASADDARVRRDYYQTLTDLYRENHIDPIKHFAHSLGMKYRAQAYGTTTDYSALSLDLDVPESEGLAGSLDESPLKALDSYREQSASISLTGKKVFSSECCAMANGAWGETWEDQISRYNAAYVAGVNQIVYHGVAQQNANGQKWPGWSPFTSQNGNGFSEAGGPALATWGDVPKITDWMSRMQYALRTGQEKVDVAVFRDVVGHGAPDVGDLSASGYTYEFVSPAHLELDSASVRDGILAPDGAGYRALVVADQDEMSLSSAQRILHYAEAGLPVVIVGSLPTHTPGLDGNDGSLRDVLDQLVAQPQVRRIPDVTGIPTALKTLGAVPAATPASPTELLTAHRDVSDGEVYLAWNPTAAPVSQTFTLTGTGTPTNLDAWSGQVTPVAAYHQVDADHTQIKVTLQPGESALYGIGRFTTATPVHVDDLADDVTSANGKLYLTGQAGTRSLMLSNGQQVDASIGQVPAKTDLTDWDLSVEDWHQDAAKNLEKTTEAFQLHGLKPWSQIPGLVNTSGIGTYTTKVTLPASWTGGQHALLNLGTVTDTFDVTVNGHHVDVDQTTAVADVSPYLQPGENTITVRVATPLRNTLRVTTGYPGQAATARQDYGLVGPVSLQPYGQVQVWPRAVVNPGGNGPSDTPVVAPSAAPRVTGVAEYGRTLHATTGTWSGTGLTYSYAWLRDGEAISGATSSTLTLDAGDIGKRIAVRVTAANQTATASSTSIATAPVAKARSALSIATKRTVKLGRNATVRVRLTSPSAGVSGTVQLRLNGHRVRALTMRDAISQRVKVRLRHRGTNHLSVRYAGSATVRPASAAVVVRVR